MKIAIFGTSTIGDYALVDHLIGTLTNGDTILVDTRLGVPNYTKNKADFTERVYERFYPDYKGYGSFADEERDHRLVDAADEVHIFYNQMEEFLRRIVDYCKAIKKPVYLYEVLGELKSLERKENVRR